MRSRAIVLALSIGLGLYAPALADYQSTVLSMSPYAYWRMDATSGNQTDISGNSRTGNSTAGTGTYAVTGLLTGDPDTAFLAQNGSYFQSASTWSASNWTIVAMVEFTTNFNYTYCVASANGIALYVNGNGASHFSFGVGGYTVNTCAGTPSFEASNPRTLNTVYQAAVVYSGTTTMKLYVNGSLIGSFTNAAFVESTQKGMAGSPSTGYTTPGSTTLDDVAWFPSALSGSQISTLYNASIGITSGSGANDMGIWMRSRFEQLLQRGY